MLRVKSFDIKDDKGINTLLTQFRLAKGAHILVSDGAVCIPYEDGEPDNNDQVICTIKEQINILAAQKEILVQSQMALSAIIEDRTTNLNELHANIAELEKSANAKGKTAKLAEMKDVAKMAEAVLSQDGKQYAMNENELRRIVINVDNLRDRINQIENDKEA